jgi:hypothetical protein
MHWVGRIREITVGVAKIMVSRTSWLGDRRGGVGTPDLLLLQGTIRRIADEAQ